MTLETATSDHSVTCDGCGDTIPPGEKYLTGINSCCGDCYRALCFSCVLKAGEMLKQASQEKILDELSAGHYDDLLRLAPLGSFAPAIGGGGWLRLTSGWIWNGHTATPGSVFPRPGGDWTGVILPSAPRIT